MLRVVALLGLLLLQCLLLLPARDVRPTILGRGFDDLLALPKLKFAVVAGRSGSGPHSVALTHELLRFEIRVDGPRIFKFRVPPVYFGIGMDHS